MRIATADPVLSIDELSRYLKISKSTLYKLAQIAYDVNCSFECKSNMVPTVVSLQNPEVQAKVVVEVKSRLGPQQMEMFTGKDSLAEVVAITTEQVIL